MAVTWVGSIAQNDAFPVMVQLASDYPVMMRHMSFPVDGKTYLDKLADALQELGLKTSIEGGGVTGQILLVGTNDPAVHRAILKDLQHFFIERDAGLDL